MTKYTMKNDIQHVLECPDVYIGDVNSDERLEYVYNENGMIEQKLVKVPEVLVRIFTEVLTNAVDNVERSKRSKIRCTTIEVDVDVETGVTTISNDGQVVPIVQVSPNDGDERMYVHSMIFGHLRTSSNYGADRRDLSGKNGVGVKCTNIFSTRFSVTGVDPVNKLKLKQVWTDNMTKTAGPVITPLSSKSIDSGYTKVTYVPDFNRFGLKMYPPEIMKIFKKLVVDSSAITPHVDFVFCDEKIPVKSLQEYSKLYFADPSAVDFLDVSYAGSDVVIAALKTDDASTKKSKAVSFVNGQLSRRGGRHVQSWMNTLSDGVLNSLNSGKKQAVKFAKSDILPYFYLFVHSRVQKPMFDGQNKDVLKHPKVDSELTVSNLKKILKWQIISTIKNKVSTAKELASLRCVEREVKRRPITDVNSYDTANKVGTTSTLILCEGLSAKAYAVSGIQVGVFGKKGRNHFGIMPLTGKFLNVKNASVAKIGVNKVVTNLIKVLNLKIGLDYSRLQNFKTLNYGTVLILTDADKDGTHIKGLIINFFHGMFPSLLKKEGFIISMETPIVKVPEKDGTDLLFYDEKEFDLYRTNHPNTTNFKYYKGLGTISSKDVPKFFGKRMVKYIFTEECENHIDKVFKDEYTDTRKMWLTSYALRLSADAVGPRPVEVENAEGCFTSTVGDFMEHEMVKYSYEDCKRSIGSCVDGFKESQRKVIFAVRKKFRHHGDFIKVAQLSGYVAEQTDYKHGEQNLCETIIKFAQDFVGSNNVTLLEPDGQFGTRLEGGKDAAAPRYIYTRPSKILKYMFREEDDAVLPMTSDGEPVFFVPVVPLVLINGSVGIGTGWSSFVPQYNPSQVVDHIRRKLVDADVGPIDIDPYYRHFKGKIVPCDDSKTKYTTYGKMKNLSVEPWKEASSMTVQVTELPVGMWSDKFKDQCNDMVEKNLVEKVVNESTVNTVNFTLVNVKPAALANIRLTTSLHTSNMVLFDSVNAITKYDTVNDVFEEYFKTRISYYAKRAAHMTEKLEVEVMHARNKLRFVTMVVEDFDLLKRSELDLTRHLEDQQFLKVADTFNYLLNIPIKGFTRTAVMKLKASITRLNADLKLLKSSTPASMWLKDLDELEPYFSD